MPFNLIFWKISLLLAHISRVSIETKVYNKFMGVTFLQHRIVTGSFSNITKSNFSKSKKLNGKFSMDKDIQRNIIYGVTCVIYVYMICLLLAGAIETASSTTTTKLHRAYDIGSHVSNDWNNILNCAVILIFKMLYSKRYGCCYIFIWLKMINYN